jgi:hypothetical protein
MKKTILTIVTIIFLPLIIFGIYYLFISFFLLTIDFREWNGFVRFLYVAISLVSSIPSTGLTILYIHDK